MNHHFLCRPDGRISSALRTVVSCVVVICGSLGTAAEWNYPLWLAVDEAGPIYVADRNLPGIWRLDGEQLQLLFQGSQKFRTPLNAVRCVTLDKEGKLLAGDSATREVYRFDADNQPHPLTDQGQGYGLVGNPVDIAVDAEGNLLVSDLELHRIVKIPPQGGSLEIFASVNAPRGLCFDAEQRLWVISGRKLIRIGQDGQQETVVDEGTFEFPHAVVVAADGVAYVSDGYAKAIWKVRPGEQPEKWVSGDPLQNPVGLDHQGDKLLVADPHAKQLFEISAEGAVTARAVQPAG